MTVVVPQLQLWLFALSIMGIPRLFPHQGWSFDVTEHEGERSTASGSFALARAAADVKGEGAYDLLKFEAGVHRVQR